MIVDLDHFKLVNDRYGHAVGDETLRSLARCLRSVTRQVDTVARFGGEEFALVLVCAGEQGARAMVTRLQDAWRSSEPLTSFSAGIAVHLDGASTTATVARADAALYRAKANGRDRIEFAGEQLVVP